MSLSLCLNVCCKHRPLYQNQIVKIPITFYNARRQQSSRTVELVDYTYDGRRVARRTHTSVDRNALTALLRSRMGLLWTFSCNCAAVDKILTDAECRVVQSVCSKRASWLQLVQRKCADARTTRSLAVIKVDRSTSSQYCACAFSAASSRFLKTFFWKKVNGCRVTLLLLILYNTLVSVTKCHGRVQTCRNMGACIACLVISAGGVCGRCWSCASSACVPVDLGR